MLNVSSTVIGLAQCVRDTCAKGYSMLHVADHSEVVASHMDFVPRCERRGVWHPLRPDLLFVTVVTYGHGFAHRLGKKAFAGKEFVHHKGKFWCFVACERLGIARSPFPTRR